MITLISILGALALAAIPITFGWRRTVDEAGMARAMGIAPPKKKFDPEKFARQTGTGLSFNQIAYGFLIWVGGGLIGGMFLGIFPAILFAIAGGLLYAGTLSDKRQEFRLKQAKDILRGLGVVETLLSQGKPLGDALDDAAQAVGPDGRMLLPHPYLHPSKDVSRSDRWVHPCERLLEQWWKCYRVRAPPPRAWNGRRVFWRSFRLPCWS